MPLPRGGSRGGRGFGPTGPPRFGKLPRLVEPALLYLLAKSGRTHGYDLINEANRLAVCDTAVDAAAVYRALRQMEEGGLVRSAWDTARGGPARRDYEITPAGRTHLKAWAEMLRRRGQAMLEFATACDELS